VVVRQLSALHRLDVLEHEAHPAGQHLDGGVLGQQVVRRPAGQIQCSVGNKSDLCSPAGTIRAARQPRHVVQADPLGLLTI
jgi:hypothetical protein